MKIKNIKIRTEENYMIASAMCKIRAIGWDVVYLKFDKKYKDYVTLDGGVFAALLMSASSKLGQDIEIDGEITEHTLEALQNAIENYASWKVGFKKIKIKAKKITKDKKKGKYEAAFFSGGVDSFYTYLKHKDTLKHLIIVNGYDVDLRNKVLWQQAVQGARALAKKENIELIEVECNIEKLVEPIVAWNYCFAGGLSAIGLLFRKKFGTVYIASSFKKDQIVPGDGSNRQVDKKWSGKNLAVIVDGEEASRFDKVEAISKEKIALEYVRVCYLNKKGTYNCRICDKCVRTMVSLEILGKLKNSKTFSKTLDLNLVKNLPVEHEIGLLFHRENLDEVRKRHGSKELEAAIVYLIDNFKHKDPPISEGVIAQAIYIDHMYLMGKAYKAFGKIKNNF